MGCSILRWSHQRACQCAGKSMQPRPQLPWSICKPAQSPCHCQTAALILSQAHTCCMSYQPLPHAGCSKKPSVCCVQAAFLQSLTVIHGEAVDHKSTGAALPSEIARDAFVALQAGSDQCQPSTTISWDCCGQVSAGHCLMRVGFSSQFWARLGFTWTSACHTISAAVSVCIEVRLRLCLLSPSGTRLDALGCLCNAAHNHACAQQRFQ